MIDPAEFETVLFDVTDHVATITLNRPEKMNAFTQRMAEEFVAMWAIIRDTDDIHVVVLRAAGDRAFSTGADRQLTRWWKDQNIWNQEDPGTNFYPRHQGVWKPVIAAVNGICAGGGFYFLNEVDIIICDENATFFDAHANTGRVASLEPIGLLARGVPFGEVARWALMGTEERITASTALRIGLVSEVVPSEQLWARADFIAKRIASRRPEAIQGTVRAMWEALDMTRTMAMRNGMAYTHIGNDFDTDTRQANQPHEFR